MDRALGQLNRAQASWAQANRAEGLAGADRRLLTELVYGCVRRQRTLDWAIDQLAKKPATAQPPDLRTLLHLGLYQLRYLDQIPVSAAVDTTVKLAKANGFRGLSGFVNGLLRQYVRRGKTSGDPLIWPSDWAQRLALQQSYPDWIVDLWRSQLPDNQVEALAQWFNQAPTIDLRVNPLQRDLMEVKTALQAQGLMVQAMLPQALRLLGPTGPIHQLPGFEQGWWMVQDSSAQLVSHVVDPQPGEMIIDACAAPGGKATHLAELMGDQGTIWACDRTVSRLAKVRQNCQRLQLQSIQTLGADSREVDQFRGQADRVLLDVPCSNLGTLHRHADARWRQTPGTVQGLLTLQQQLLNQAATWVKPGGRLVYATCTLHPQENQSQVYGFLDRHPGWQLDPPQADFLQSYITPEGWLQVWPHRHHMDGFFVARLVYCPS